MELEEPASRLKRMSMVRLFPLTSGALAWALFLVCGLVACSGTEVPDPDDSVTGMVRGADGSPAVAARVIAWGDMVARQTANDQPGTVYRDTQYTDGKGNFAFGKELAAGTYQLYFEDPVAPVEKRPVQRSMAPSGDGKYVLPPVRLAPPTVLLISVQDQGTHEPLKDAECWITPTPYPHKNTGSEGITYYFLPPGRYEVSCYYPWSTRSDSIVVTPDSASLQMVLYLTPYGENPNPLSAPTNFVGTYDENSGAVDLKWSPVSDIRLSGYGVRRQDSALGGAPRVLTMQEDTSFRDLPFAGTDSAQFKKLTYGVYSTKRDPGGSIGSSRSPTIDIYARRPWAYGPRIDSLAPLDSLGSYHVGDSVRIVAAWTNRIRENDSLIWRLNGVADLLETRVHPAASGKDTLVFALPATGDYQVSLTIRDAEGYRSWLALPLRF